MATAKSRKTAASPAAVPPPAPAPSGIPVVGIGASAGGLAAFEAFFAGLPADVDPGMAFVLVQHLASDHKSILVELIRRYTRMRVFEVEDGMVVQPNCAYIIPPGRDMAFLDGRLQLLEPSAPRGPRLTIDFFFRSLAQDQREHAIGIVLSGTGSDGTLGVRAIKGEGGMVMVQSPESTEFDGMPRSALATGLVDYELPPAQMGAQLMAYVSRAFGQLPHAPELPMAHADNALRKVFVLLRDETGHDFSQYKPNTIHRRIARRMAVHQIETLEAYVKTLQQSRLEVEALFRDLLIGVTSFFRDPEAFAALEEQVIAKLFAGKAAGSAIRVWSLGCSTGEEAYSVAMQLQERMQLLKQDQLLQVFATDIDAHAIASARSGLYPSSVGTDLPPPRLARHFTSEAHGSALRIHKAIRDLLVFSEQDVIKDPPFSRIDLILCRNLLIYMGAELQRKLIPLFHYAIKPGGYLFLGSSESVGDFGHLFETVDRKAKIYRRRDDVHGAQRLALGRFMPPLSARGALPPPAGRALAPGRLPLRLITEQALLQQIAPVAALVNDKGDILYIHGRSGAFLEPPAGEAGISNILAMAREGLRPALAVALRKAVAAAQVVRTSGIRVKSNGHQTTVDLCIRPLAEGGVDAAEMPLYLVILEEQPAGERETLAAAQPPADGAGAAADVDAQIAALRQELRSKEEYLQTANEELETSNEELKSSNEEMQSVNEELQSTNEELETSKEELQSVNEELATVNAELQSRVLELSRANNDMNNLMAGTGIATVFVDHQLRILRFTPAATQIINLIPGDIGRSVGHVVSNLVGYDRLLADAQTVLDSLVPLDLEVQTLAGRWYRMRIQPYRTLDNVIEGAVITFVNVTAMKEALLALGKERELARMALVMRDATDAMLVQDLEGRILAWNPAARQLYGWSLDEALAMNVRDLVPTALREAALASVQSLGQAQLLAPYLTQRIRSDGATLNVQITATALVNDTGRMYAIATTERPQPARSGDSQPDHDGAPERP